MTPKQEKFCQVYIECGNASEAYRQSYDVGENTKDKTIWRKAKELLDHGKVSARIAVLQLKHQNRHEITVDSLTKEYEEARNLAKNEKQAPAMVSATTGKAKLHGLLVDKQHHSGKIEHEHSLKEVDDVELRNRCIWFLAGDDAVRAKQIAGFVKALAT